MLIHEEIFCLRFHASLHRLFLLQLFQRYKSEVDSKLMLSKAVSSGVSKDGFSLFSFLKKT